MFANGFEVVELSDGESRVGERRVARQLLLCGTRFGEGRWWDSLCGTNCETRLDDLPDTPGCVDGEDICVYGAVNEFKVVGSGG